MLNLRRLCKSGGKKLLGANRKSILESEHLFRMGQSKLDGVTSSRSDAHGADSTL